VNIPENTDVYWQNAATAVSIGLRRPSYFSKGQGAGVVFNRETAIEFSRRAHVISAIDASAPYAFTDDRAVMPEKELFKRDLWDVCAGHPAPTILILPQRATGAHSIHWRSPYPLNILYASPNSTGNQRPAKITKRVRDFYIYDCRVLSSLEK